MVRMKHKAVLPASLACLVACGLVAVLLVMAFLEPLLRQRPRRKAELCLLWLRGRTNLRRSIRRAGCRVTVAGRCQKVQLQLKDRGQSPRQPSQMLSLPKSGTNWTVKTNWRR